VRTWRVVLIARWETGHESTMDRVEAAQTATAALLKAANALAIVAHRQGYALDACESLISTVQPFTPQLQADAA
jgi:hypothetical protein